MKVNVEVTRRLIHAVVAENHVIIKARRCT